MSGPGSCPCTAWEEGTSLPSYTFSLRYKSGTNLCPHWRQKGLNCHHWFQGLGQSGKLLGPAGPLPLLLGHATVLAKTSSLLNVLYSPNFQSLSLGEWSWALSWKDTYFCSSCTKIIRLPDVWGGRPKSRGSQQRPAGVQPVARHG